MTMKKKLPLSPDMAPKCYGKGQLQYVNVIMVKGELQYVNVIMEKGELQYVNVIIEKNSSNM